MTKKIVVADDGVELAVFESGVPDGDLVILVHGIRTCHKCWDQLSEKLSSTYRVVTYDQRGHAESGAHNGKNCTIEQIGRDLGAVVRASIGANSDRKAYVLGHSMGGMTIGSWASQCPDDLAASCVGIALCNTAFDHVLSGNRIFGVRMPDWKLVRKGSGLLGLISGGEGFFSRLITQRLNFWGPVTREQCDLAVIYAGTTSRRAMFNFLPSICSMDLSAGVQNFVVPTTVLIADHDVLTPPPLGKSIAHRLAEYGYLAGCREIIDSGHATFANQPEQFYEIILAAIGEAFSS